MKKKNINKYQSTNPKTLDTRANALIQRIMEYSLQSISNIQPKPFEKLLSNDDRADLEAQIVVGNAYSYGQGVEEDKAEAFKWYRLAAD